MKRPKNSSSECLVSNYTDAFILSKFHIFSYIASIFENYLTVFHSDAPLVPFFFDALGKIFLRLLGLIYEKDSMAASGGPSIRKNWLIDKGNLQDLNKIDVEAGAQTALKELNLFIYLFMYLKADKHQIHKTVYIK